MVCLLIAFAATVLSSLVLIRQASRWGFIDHPGERKVHAVPTPRTGGLAMAFGAAATLAASLACGRPCPVLPWQTWAAGAGFLGLGALDDRFTFHPRHKFLWLALFSLLAAWPWAFAGPDGSPYTAHLGAWGLQVSRWVAFPVLALWFLAVPNAVNIEDAINGYMAGFTFILLGVALIQGVDVLIPMGALAGFLLLNWPRAKHFLGDTGSLGCGFVIAEALLRAGGSQRPLLALALTAPISLDVSMGIVRRIRQNMSLFAADRLTCPHHLAHLCGQSHGWAAFILWTNTAVIAFLTFCAPAFAMGWLGFYALTLVLFNRASLFKPHSLFDPDKQPDPLE